LILFIFSGQKFWTR